MVVASRGTGLLWVLLGAATLTHSAIPSPVAYGAVVLAYGLIGLNVVRGSVRIAAPRRLTYYILTFAGLYGLHVTVVPYFSELGFSVIRPVVFIFALGATVLFVPQLASERDFLHVLAIGGSVLSVLGIAIVLVGPMSIGEWIIAPWRWYNPFPGLTNFRAATSIFVNPNTLATVAGSGYLAALALLLSTGDRQYRVAAVASGLGVIFAGSLAGVTGAAAATGVFAAARWLSTAGYRASILGGYAASMVGVLFVGGLFAQSIPVSLTGRRELWAAAVEAIARRPLLGYGPGDTRVIIRPYISPEWAGLTMHSSFWRVGATLGLVGLSLYIVMYTDALQYTVRQPKTPILTGIVAVNAFLLVRQTFASFSIFGLSLTSILAALALGYLFVSPSAQGD